MNPQTQIHTQHCVLSKIETKLKNIPRTQCMIAAMGIVSLSIQAVPAGRLAHFLPNWQIITGDRWVLNTVRGYRIAFTSQPHQARRPHPAQLNQSQKQLVLQEISKLISKGAIQELTNMPEGGFVSTLFLVPKKGGGQRPVINLKNLNSFVEALQNGGYKYPEKPVTERRLASQDRSQGRVFLSPGQPGAQKILVLPSRGEVVPVHLPPLQPGVSTMGFYQDPEADSSS